MCSTELLLSNRPPVKTAAHMNFYDAFSGMLKDADELYIAVGYVTAESLAELKRLAELNGVRRLILTIGMHYIEKKFTRTQYDAAKALHRFLKENGTGEVRVVQSFRYHGKIYLAGKNSELFIGIIGSDNLRSIIDDYNNYYEASVLVRDKELIADMKSFTDSLNEKAAVPFDECIIDSFALDSSGLDSQIGVERSGTPETIGLTLTGLRFEIPIKTDKTAPKSNLNIYFGKGRENHGIIIPRHWYEAEIIVPKAITKRTGYPQEGTETAVFDVITDDGYKFRCYVSGNDSKNLRSKDDLKILGRWLKGRMEDSGALRIGEPVTEKVLADYGRNTFTLCQTSEPNLWYLDFGVSR